MDLHSFVRLRLGVAFYFQLDLLEAVVILGDLVLVICKETLYFGLYALLLLVFEGSFLFLLA